MSTTTGSHREAAAAWPAQGLLLLKIKPLSLSISASFFESMYGDVVEVLGATERLGKISYEDHMQAGRKAGRQARAKQFPDKPQEQPGTV